MQHLVSIIIPTFNSVKSLSETLDSVLAQTSPNWECVLVDDGSTDATENIIIDYQQKDQRFSFYKRPEGLLKGPSSCRNYGVEKASGGFLVFLDSDDLLAPFCIENRIAAFQAHNDCDFLVFQMQRFQDTPSVTEKSNEIEQDKNRVLGSFIQLHGHWQVTSPIYKTDFFKQKVGFNAKLIVFEDLEVAIKAILLANEFLQFEHIDCYYRNDANYQAKYDAVAVKIKMVEAFNELVKSLAIVMLINTQKKFKNNQIKKDIVSSYKKLFNFYILEHSKKLNAYNTIILNTLVSNTILNNCQTFKFFLIDRILLPFASIKGSGIARLIKKIYN